MNKNAGNILRTLLGGAFRGFSGAYTLCLQGIADIGAVHAGVEPVSATVSWERTSSRSIWWDLHASWRWYACRQKA